MMTSHSDIPPEKEVVIPKSPLKDVFPAECPPSCDRNCKQFYQVHSKLISFALYATQDPRLDPRTICVYAFSCGMELQGEKFVLDKGETPVQLVERIVPALIRVFTEAAVQDLADGATKQ